jgi:hypothetical protein
MRAFVRLTFFGQMTIGGQRKNLIPQQIQQFQAALELQPRL